MKQMGAKEIKTKYLESFIFVKEEALPEKKEGILYVSNSPGIAKLLNEAGYPVLGILDSKEDAAEFSGLLYLAEEEALRDPVYLEQIYCRMTDNPYTVLIGENWILRETVEEDLDALYALYAQEGMTRYMEALFSNQEEEREYIRNYRKYIYGFYGFGIWTVAERDTGEIMGRIGLEINESSDQAQLGYMLGKKWQKKGLATEICRAVLRYGFEDLDFPVIEARTHTENLASVKLLKRLGFTEKGEENGLMVYTVFPLSHSLSNNK